MKINLEDLRTFIWMARRYANGRHSYAPVEFNNALTRVRKGNPDFTEKIDKIEELTDYPQARVGNIKPIRDKE